MMDCLFCKIVSGDIPSKKLYEDDKILAFYDISPQAPIHFLVIPKKHIESCAALTQENSDIVADIFAKISDITKKLGLNDGYRVVTNCGESAGQTVLHLHFHVLGGRLLSWPPG